MSFTVAVAGASGYAGGEALRLLAGHPQAQVGAVTANASVGQKLGRQHPHIAALADRELQATDAGSLKGHDVIILALPHGKSAQIAAELEQVSPESILVDLGADHRLEDAQAWREYYGGEHAGAWTYGMPELITAWGEGGAGRTSKQREKLVAAKRIAVPGCNVTAVTLALAPAIAAGTVSPQDLVAVLANGVSGAGKAAKEHLMASEILGAASPYAVGGSHRHIPEIIQNLTKAAAGAPQGARPTISFTPTLVPMSRGILATVTAKPGPNFDLGSLRRPWLDAYGQLGHGPERFVSILEEGSWPSTAQTLGANTAMIQVAFDERAERLVVITAIDNLVKGTAGAAIQSINLALGLPEETGLELNGVAP
ncbi:MAG: N-acetyl-gamma-glutamyl-phosphate reductase [Bifidobacteriaceae bacterium]|jgi:N-acetyl-gamma-glutamyl-phosphate reductase|nr:N-acetyl-gamma-glutamyl-phosphate reductase [Bifidobacteriaceae bacterium]